MTDEMSSDQWRAWAQQHAEPYLRLLHGDLPGVSAVILASSDGFELAGIAPPELQLSRLAAMASSMQGLGDAMARDTGLNMARDIIVDSDAGKIVLMSVPGGPPSLVLMVVVSDQSAFGHLLLQCRTCCVAIGKQLQSRAPNPVVVNY